MWGVPQLHIENFYEQPNVMPFLAIPKISLHSIGKIMYGHWKIKPSNDKDSNMRRNWGKIKQKRTMLSNYFFSHSFGYSKANFRSLTEVASLYQCWSLILSCELDLEVIHSHVTTLGLGTWPSAQWGMNKEPFQFWMQHFKQDFPNSIKGKWKPFPIGRIVNFVGRFFNQVMAIWEGVVLITWIFFKARNYIL